MGRLKGIAQRAKGIAQRAKGIAQKEEDREKRKEDRENRIEDRREEGKKMRRWKNNLLPGVKTKPSPLSPRNQITSLLDNKILLD